MPFDAVFDARSIQPRQGGVAHPVGNKFPFKLTDTKVVPTKDNKGGMFEVEFTSPAGSVIHRYNLWNESEQARKISQEQLSALCHATGIFTVDFKNDGKALIGAEGLMDIGFQKGHEPSADKPEGGYVELKKVYDKFGNEPGKAQQSQPSGQSGFNQQPNQAPQGQQGQPNVQSGFSPNPAQNNAPAGQAGGWGGQPQTAQQGNAGGGWNQAPAAEKPPWG